MKPAETTARSCRALVAGKWSYGMLFRNLARDIKPYAKKHHGVDIDFVYDFEDNGPDAWGRAQEFSYDMFFIDYATDVQVRIGRTLSESIRELHPDSFMVGMSYVMSYSAYAGTELFNKSVFNKLIDTNVFDVAALAITLVEIGMLPEEPEIEVDDIDDKMDRLMKDPKARVAMKKEGW